MPLNFEDSYLLEVIRPSSQKACFMEKQGRVILGQKALFLKRNTLLFWEGKRKYTWSRHHPLVVGFVSSVFHTNEYKITP